MVINNIIAVNLCLFISVATAATVSSSIPSCYADKSIYTSFTEFKEIASISQASKSCIVANNFERTDSSLLSRAVVSRFCTESAAGTCCLTVSSIFSDNDLTKPLNISAASENILKHSSLLLINSEKYEGSPIKEKAEECKKGSIKPGLSNKCKARSCGYYTKMEDSENFQICGNDILLTYKSGRLIRASCKNDGFMSSDELVQRLTSTAKKEGQAKCFPASATVELDSGRHVRMDELSVGDRVRVGAGGTAFSTVFMFTHKTFGAVSDFMHLETGSGTTLTATAEHFIHANNKLIAAGKIQVGDWLTLATGEKTKVVTISSRRMDGLYNPQTAQGDIVVNGVLASTYTSAIKPNLAHTSLAPLRAVYKWLGVHSMALEGGRPVSMRM